MSRSYATRANTRSRGLWELVAEPGPTFKWGVVLRRSTLNKALDERGEITRFENSTERQELEVVWHIRNKRYGCHRG